MINFLSGFGGTSSQVVLRISQERALDFDFYNFHYDA
jgi:hypothetical protein